MSRSGFRRCNLPDLGEMLGNAFWVTQSLNSSLMVQQFCHKEMRLKKKWESGRFHVVSATFRRISGDVRLVAFKAFANSASIYADVVWFVFFKYRGRGRAGEGARRAPVEAALFLGVPTRSGDGHKEETGRRRPLVPVLELQHSAQHAVPPRG